MKKLLLIVFTLVSLFSQAQDETLHFNCYKASVNKYNTVTKHWDETFSQPDANYEITLNADILSINANSMQVFRLVSVHKSTFINANGNAELQYKAINLTSNSRECDITIIAYKNTDRVNFYVFYFDTTPFINLAYSTLKY